MARDLDRLLRPRSVAVIGGGAWGRSVVEQCDRMGFSGPVWPVHPVRREIAGHLAVPTLAHLPEAPDAAFVAVNRETTVEIVAGLAEMGAGGAVCFASGFAEADGELGDGAALEERLVAAAGDMPILGPNCYGLLNYLDGAALWPDQHGGRRCARGAAIVAQSSNMLINITMQARGLPLAYAVAAGNQAQTPLSGIAAALIEDPRVTCLGLHVEGVRDLAAFEGLAARARALGKPVAALRVGRSASARRATLSHTASLTGGDAAARAFFARLGVPLLHSLPELLETLKLLHVHGSLPGTRLAAMSCSGGEASLLADTAEGRAVCFPPLPEPTRARLAAALGPAVHLANPLDYHTYVWGDAEAMRETFAAILASGADLGLLVLDFPRTDRCSDAAWECAVEAIRAVARETGAPAAVVATLPEGMPEARADAFLAAGIAPLAGLPEALAAVEAAAEIARARARPWPAPVLAPPAATGAPRTLGEAEAKRRLAAHGLTVPEGRTAATPAGAAAAAGALGGPVALKALGVAHKTEGGAVRLGLAGAEAVRAAAEAMEAPHGFLVEAMVGGAVAELLVGVTRDPAHGLALTIGAGGTLAELLDDTATLLLPVARAEVRAALGGLRVARLLAGHRGRPPADIDAVLDAVLAVAAFAGAEDARLEELDVNPLLATPAGAVAADALVVLRDAAPPPPDRESQP
jgi:acyl-CoA synthetase (NDP forming)